MAATNKAARITLTGLDSVTTCRASEPLGPQGRRATNLIRRAPPRLQEVLRIDALSRPELLFGVASALRRGRIAPGLELAIIDCPDGEAPALRAEIEARMQEIDVSDDN